MSPQASGILLCTFGLATPGEDGLVSCSEHHDGAMHSHLLTKVSDATLYARHGVRQVRSCVRPLLLPLSARVRTAQE